MLSKDKITEIYFIIDEFNKEFDKTITAHSLKENSPIKQRNKRFMLSNSEVMTILVLFHDMGYKNLKHFYEDYIKKHIREEFPNSLLYNRFTELQALFGRNCL
jgi:hypothetical protein